MKKRILASLLSIIMILSLLPTVSFAVEVDPTSATSLAATGDTFTVENITYEVTGDNTVSVTKKGDGTLYSGGITIPSTVSYENTTYNVTAIGKDAFRSCKDLGAVIVPSSVKTIGQTAFGYIGSPMDMGTNIFSITLNEGCLLYTSDAADD